MTEERAGGGITWIRRGETEAVRLSTLLAWVVGGGITVAGGLYVWQSSGAFVTGLASGALCLTVPLALMSRTKALYLLVLVTHLGPIARVHLPAVGMLNLGDLYVGVLAGVLLLDGARGRALYAGPYFFLVPVFAALSVASAFLSVDAPTAFPGLINQLEIGFVYLLTLNAIRTRREAWTLLVMVGLAVMVSAWMHMGAFSQGRTLLLSLQGGQAEHVTAPDVRRAILIGYFTKTSFFYASFIGSCAVAMALAAGRMLGFGGSGSGSLVFWFAVGLSTLSSSLVSGSRTPIISAGLGGVLAGLYAALSSRSLQRSMKAGFVLAGLFPVLAGGAILLQRQFLSETQRYTFSRMFTEDADDSMRGRLSMWTTALDRLTDSPRPFITGIGPDLGQRGADLPAVRKLMTIPGEWQVPSFHNFYIDVLFQNGLLFWLAMLLVVGTTVTAMIRRLGAAGD